MNIAALRPFLVITSVTLAFYFVERRAERFLPSKVEGHRFRYGSLTLSILLAMVGVFMWGALCESTSIRWLFAALFLLISGLLVYMLGTSVVVRDGELKYTRLLRTTTVPLSSIVSVVEEEAHDRYVIQDKQGNRYALSRFLAGAKTLATYLRRSVERESAAKLVSAQDS